MAPPPSRPPVSPAPPPPPFAVVVLFLFVRLLLLLLQVYWRFGMQLSEDLLGSTRAQDPIFHFKPWPSGGTTNSLSVASASSAFVAAGDDDRGNVRTRATEKRAGGKLDAAGLAREGHRKKIRPVVRGMLKEAQDQVSTHEPGLRGEDEDEGGARGEGGPAGGSL